MEFFKSIVDPIRVREPIESTQRFMCLDNRALTTHSKLFLITVSERPPYLFLEDSAGKLLDSSDIQLVSIFLSSEI